MPEDPKVRAEQRFVKSDILKMIESHVSLAGRFMDDAVDVYSKGNSPGPVDQYTSGSGASIFERVSNPAFTKVVQEGKIGEVAQHEEHK